MLKDCRSVEWFEDYEVGDAFRAEPFPFSEDEIIAFARLYDPQPFHIDSDAARRSPFGGLMASGTHLLPRVGCAIMAGGFLNGRAMGAPGIALEFKRPVRPRDKTISRVTALRASESLPDRGSVDFVSETTNQNGNWPSPSCTARYCPAARPPHRPPDRSLRLGPACRAVAADHHSRGKEAHLS